MKAIFSTLLIIFGYFSFFGSIVQGIVNGLTLLGLILIVSGYALRDYHRSLSQKPRKQKNY